MREATILETDEESVEVTSQFQEVAMPRARGDVSVTRHPRPSAQKSTPAHLRSTPTRPAELKEWVVSLEKLVDGFECCLSSHRQGLEPPARFLDSILPRLQGAAGKPMTATAIDKAREFPRGPGASSIPTRLPVAALTAQSATSLERGVASDPEMSPSLKRIAIAPEEKRVRSLTVTRFGIQGSAVPSEEEYVGSSTVGAGARIKVGGRALLECIRVLSEEHQEFILPARENAVTRNL